MKLAQCDMPSVNDKVHCRFSVNGNHLVCHRLKTQGTSTVQLITLLYVCRCLKLLLHRLMRQLVERLTQLIYRLAQKLGSLH